MEKVPKKKGPVIYSKNTKVDRVLYVLLLQFTVHVGFTVIKIIEGTVKL